MYRKFGTNCVRQRKQKYRLGSLFHGEVIKRDFEIYVETRKTLKLLIR